MEKKRVLDEAIKALRIQNHSSPTVMMKVIKEFKLDDFATSNKTIRKFLYDSAKEKQSFKHMISMIKDGLIRKHPAVVEFLQVALEKKWLNHSVHVEYALHVAYLLEALTVGMCNSHDLFIEVQDHYRRKELERGINSLHTIRTFMHALGITHSLFGTVKALSVDPAMVYFRTQRGFTKSHLKDNEARQLLKDGKINFIEYRLLSPIRKHGLEHINELIRINIYEAGITEYEKKLRTNSISAHELNEDIKKNPPVTRFKEKAVMPEYRLDSFYRSLIKEKNRFPAIGFSQEWVSLYITWNMAFVLNDLDDLDIIMPKLFIPSIINCESENFLGARIVSLWLTVNHEFYRKYEHKEVLGPKNKDEMAQAWAEINKKYAFDLAERETHEDSKVLMRSFNRFFSQPLHNWFRMVKALFFSS